MRLDKLVSDRYGLSRRAAQEAVRKGQVDVDGARCLEPGLEVEPDAAVAFDVNRPRFGGADRHLSVLHEDPEILVVDKPAGLLTQPTQEREGDTLLERVGRYLMRKRGRTRPYVGIVHRLDRDTTGTILVATSPQVLRPLQAMFRAHAARREYLAVVEGAFLTPEGTIDLPLVEDRGDGRRGVARGRGPARGVEAVTHYRVVEAFGTVASLLSCRLETGRTHQVRIHLAAIGHPVVADPVYRDRSLPKFPVPFSRQALHARSLELAHPSTGQPVRAEAPLPADLAGLLEALRGRAGSPDG
ncbi:Ribosomal large subunit pseudouridine synthase D [Aquisphaera giovannonii]|uniref:Pseudouridine synthase n=1 Tax=Aquisphaera giovannonii TaxID=406548 RepID=A0A5B9VX40_9BACT|nr:RluA family pseudouridine synthase [Aquisphaera giovannonii]QEH32517.1 Ribosomal large subunit pseudouridine synthase D [Aquisphaera giovannonii]